MRSGLEVLLQEEPIDLAGVRFGLLANHASVDREFRGTCGLLAQRYPAGLQALFSPQHGYWSVQQANMVESPHAIHPRLRVPIYSLYSEIRRPRPEMLNGLNLLIVDLPDVGTRVYTYVWTLLHCLRACAEANLEVLILDRPNPLGGEQVEGAVLGADYRSFVGEACIPMRHALTVSELGRWLNESQQIRAKLQVVPLEGWDRRCVFDETGLPWVPPSPNLPTFVSALVYPGQVLLEGTNLSEGRGTTTPFEVVGAPFIDSERLADELNDRALPGVRFRPVRFRPTFDKWQGAECGGVQWHVTDAHEFRPYATTLHLLSVIKMHWPDEFEWLPPPYEYETQKPPIDILSGDDRLRVWLDEQQQLTETQIDQLCTSGVAEWNASAAACRLY
jgi:uncharacterized protein YbbC (DUF1343 family)